LSVASPNRDRNLPNPTLSLPPELLRGIGRKHLPGLDGIRAIAVSLVILYHCGLPVPGGTGVLLFFVLSGFLITWLLLEEANGSGTVSLRHFYARRALRILPAFYLYTVAALAYLWLRHRPVDYSQLTAALLYFNNYWQGIHGDPNTGFSHTWSLAVEEQFYLLWPVLFLLLWRNPRRMAWSLAVAIGVVWIYRLVLLFGFHVNQGYLYEAFDSRADSLTLGCLLAVLLHSGFAARFFHLVCGGPWMAALTVLLFVVSTLAEQSAGFDYRDTVGFAVNGTLSFLLIAQTIAGQDWAGLLNRAPVRYLGRISYALYLWQQMVIPVTDKLLAGAHPVVRIAAGFIAVTAVASASWFGVEKPILGLKKKLGVEAVLPANRPQSVATAQAGIVAGPQSDSAR